IRRLIVTGVQTCALPIFAMTATAVVVVVGVPLALLMSRRRFFGKSLIEGLIVVPMVMPPTVVGYAIILLLGARGWVGQWLNRARSEERRVGKGCRARWAW